MGDSTDDAGWLPALDEGPQERAERAEAAATAIARLSALKPREGRALALLGFGYSYNEIARLEGWTYTKVNRVMTEARLHLKELSEASAPEVGPRVLAPSER